MELILGGAYQGKLEYALQLYSIDAKDVAEAQIDKTKRIVNNLQDYIWAELKKQSFSIESVESFAQENPDIIFICDEIGCGIVPIDPLERQYRDTVGRVCCYLAKNAKRVHRLTAGIPSVIKDA